jgi:hypothetical protein
VNPWEKGVWCLTIVLTAAVLFQLYRNGLVRIYKLLFGYLALDFLSSIAGLFISFHSIAYAYYYFSAQTLKIVVSAFMLVEIYSVALERHPALAQFGRSMVGYILLVAAIVPVAGLYLDHSAAAGAHPYVRTFFLFEQTMDAMMAIFLILLSVFLAWFPVRMRRNVIVYLGGFIVWSLSRSAVVHLINQWFNNRHLTQMSNIAQMCVTLGCLYFWMVGFKREGEVRTAVVGHLWNRAEAERLTERLDAINDGLARMRHKVKQH